ncbi:MAG: methionyl-tRNA formyltransferase [Bacteriovoracaceae bacterium]|nr:methionyl-tRNA formyltransferase [Bacteriovoracaceae bacterium]
MEKIKIIFCGTPALCLPTLNMLVKNPLVDLLMIITPPDKPAGRKLILTPPATAEFAKKNNIPLRQTGHIASDINLISEIRHLSPDIILVFAFSGFLSEEILNLPKLGCFNIHTSLLPKYRGAAPIQYALLRGDHITGISIQKMVKKMDAGDIALKEEITIAPSDNLESLSLKFEDVCASTAFKFLAQLHTKNISLTKQDEDQVTFAPSLKKEQGFLDFKNNEIKNLINQVRALNPWPGTYFLSQGKKIKVLQLEESPEDVPCGKVETHKHKILVGCKKGTLRLLQVQAEGKKPCKDSEFLKGLREPIILDEKEFL